MDIISEGITKTPRDIQRPVEEVDFTEIPLWPSDLVAEAFFRIRDERFLYSSASPIASRKIPWRYLENGCFLRAALVRGKLEEWNYPPVRKIFCFGPMRFKTEWSKSGFVQFKDHVAVVTRTHQGPLVIDPIVDFEAPLLVNDWISILFSESNSSLKYSPKVSICSPLTVGHNSNAFENSHENEVGRRNGEMKSMDFFADEFLDLEWKHLIDLGKDPYKILGENT